MPAILWIPDCCWVRLDLSVPVSDRKRLSLSGARYTNNWIKTEQQINQDALASAQRSAVANLQARFPNLHYAAAEGKLGGDVDVAQDSTGGIGVHPTQLAHLHMAEFVAEKLTVLLEQIE
jgi:hypothetical protein